MKSSFVALVVLLWVVSLFSVINITRKVYSLEFDSDSFVVRVVQFIASFSNNAKLVVKEVRGFSNEDPVALLIPKSKIDHQNWEGSFPCPQDDGFLLLSGVDAYSKTANVRLISAKNGKTIKIWSPNWRQIAEDAKILLGQKIDVGRAIAGHPLLLKNGELLFNVQEVLVKIGLDHGSKAEILGVKSHHSIEFSSNPMEIVTPSVSYNFFRENSYLRNYIRDESILTYSLNNHAVDNRSFSKIMFDNGLDALIFGHSGTKPIQQDLIHLNQISVAQIDGSFWKKGDQLISSRHLSAIFLYRPDDNKVTWHQVGPWKNQHSVHFVDQNRIALLDNNVYGYQEHAPDGKNFVKPTDINRIFVIDFKFGIPAISEPYKNLLESKGLRPKTITEGRVRVLPDGGVFFEDTNNGRHFRLAKDHLMWSRANNYNSDYIGRVAWSRYLTPEECGFVLEHNLNISSNN